MAWELFNWGSRGPWYKTGVKGIYMAHVFIPDGMRIVLQANNLWSGELIHTFHAKVPSGSPGFGDVTAVAAVVRDWWNNSYRNICSTDVQGSQVVVTGTNTVPAAQAVLPLTQAGTQSGAANTAGATLCIKSTSHLSGRSNRGRQYTFPTIAASLDTANKNYWTTAYVNAAVASFNGLVANMAAAGYTLGIGSYTLGIIRPIVEYVSIDHLVDYQRRRGEGRGR